MKALLVTSAFPVLYNSFTMNEIANLQAKGVEIDILSLARTDSRIVNAQTTHLADRVVYCSDYLVGGHPGFSSWLDKQSGRLQRRVSEYLYTRLGEFLFGQRLVDLQGMDQDCYDRLKWKRYALPNLAEWASTRNPDVIHGMFGNRPATMAMLLSRLCGVPFSFETYAFDLFVDFPYSQEKLEQASTVFTTSEYNKRYLVAELGAEADKVSVIRAPIDKKACDSVVDTERSPRHVVAVCRLHPIKGLEDSIRAFAEVAEEFPDAKYSIVGEGELRPRLEALISELGMGERVHLLGSMGSLDALRKIAGSSFGLMPSVIAADGDRDGIPTFFVEAMYLGLPVISTRVSGIPELIDDGEDGILVDPGDIGALADSLRLLLADPERVERMGCAARKKVNEVYYATAAEDVLIATWQKLG